MKSKERLLEAALALFSEKGFKAATIREITHRVGLTPGAFYNHFESKDSLLRAVYDHYTGLYYKPRNAADTAAEYERLLAQHGPAGLFAFLTKSYVDVIRSEKLAQLTRIIMMEQYTNPVAAEIAFRDRQILFSSMEDLFVLMDRLGYIRVKNPRHSGRLLGYVYLGFTAGNLYDFYMENKDPADIAAREIEIIMQYLNGILINP